MDCSKRVSIIIPTYKRSDMIQNAVDSCLNQTYPNVEIIVVDDNDPSWEARAKTELVMEKYRNEPRIKYIKHERNKNGSAARNTGIRNSTGDFLCFLDDDDEFFPGKVEAVVQCLNNRDSSWGACYCNYQKVTNGKTVSNKVKGYEGNLYVQALARNLYILPGSNLTVRREVAIEVGGFDEGFRRNQDIEFLTKILRKYKIAYADVLGTKYVIHADENRKLVDPVELRGYYLEKFGDQIEALPEKQKKYVMRQIDLQTVRTLVSMRDFDRVKEIVGKRITYSDCIRYYAYLVIRKIRKASYGYDFREM